MDETAMLCATLRVPFNLIMIAVYFTAIVIFTGLVLLLIAARKCFHPLFCLLFTVVILAYIICNILTVTNMTLQVTNFDGNEIYSVIATMYQMVYIYLTCTVTSCVLERSFATIFSSTYEQCRKWQVMILGQLLTALVIFLHVHVYHFGGIVSDMVQLSLSIVILMCLTALLIVNRRLTLTTRGLRSLTCRYQLTENVRALKLLVPLVLFDTCVSVADMTGTIFFNVRPEFQPEKCAISRMYLPAYVVLRLAAVILQYAIPVCIIRHESVRRVVAMHCGKVKAVSQRSAAFEIKNVLGTVLSKESSQKNYFSYLQQQWKI